MEVVKEIIPERMGSWTYLVTWKKKKDVKSEEDVRMNNVEWLSSSWMSYEDNMKCSTTSASRESWKRRKKIWNWVKQWLMWKIDKNRKDTSGDLELCWWYHTAPLKFPPRGAPVATAFINRPKRTNLKYSTEYPRISTKNRIQPT